MISKEDIEKIRKAVNLIDYLSFRGVEANRSGSTWKALCPIHSERSPSFHIHPERNTYKCFGCGSGGDVFNLVEDMDQLSFYGAIQELAEYAGIELTEQEDENYLKLKRLYSLTAEAATWFRTNFVRLPDEHPAKQNFVDRNLLELANEDDSIGFAPNNGLVSHLNSKKFSNQEIKEAGLLSEKGNPLFRKRIIWSIKNIQGKIIGFTARKIYETDEGGKYINSPQTVLYNKSNNLFGLYEAHKYITKEQKVYVVEGQTDVMAFRAAGIHNVVAPNGTSFGKEHSLILQRLADRGKESKQFIINFCFDADTAGVKAAKRLFELDPALHTIGNIITLPEGDPCDIRIKYGDEGLIEIIEKNNISLMEFILKKELEEWDVKTPEGQAKFIKEAQTILQNVDNPIVLESYKRKISWWTGVPLSTLTLNHSRRNNNNNTEKTLISSGELRKRVLAALLQHPTETYDAIQRYNIVPDMFKNEGKIILEKAIESINQQTTVELVLPTEIFDNPKSINELLFVELYKEVDPTPARLNSIVDNICKVFVLNHRATENNLIQARVMAASEDNNVVEDLSLLEEILSTREAVPSTRKFRKKSS